MGLSKLSKDYFISKKLFIEYPLLHNIILSFFSALYMLSLYYCTNIIYNSLILPLLMKVISIFNKVKDYILRMSGWGFGSTNSNNNGSTSNPHQILRLTPHQILHLTLVFLQILKEKKKKNTESEDDEKNTESKDNKFDKKSIQ